MFFPSFLPAGGLKYANMASFQASPLEALPVVKLRDPPHCTVGNADFSSEPPFRYLKVN